MDQYLPYVIAFAVILIVAVVVVLMRRRNKKAGSDVQNYYIDGLNRLIDGDLDGALEKLRETVKLDTGFVDAYIKIAEIMLKKGAGESAIKVFRDLLVRPNLSKKQQIAINKGLARAHRFTGQYLKALDSCANVILLDKKDRWTREFELDIYEEMGDWQSAFDLVKKNSDIDKNEKNNRLACYKVEQGRQFVELKKERESRIRFREAIKLSPSCVQAYLELSDSYMRENRPSDALNSLKKMVEKNEHFSGLAFVRLKQVLFEMGHFSELEGFFRDLIKSNPEVVDAYVGLAEILEKKGELLEAVAICNKGLSMDEASMDIKLALVRLQSKLGNDDKAAEIASDLAGQLLQDRNNFSCTTCGYRARDYFWHCPQCKSWNSAQRGD